jgi:hypothetical protein
MSTDVKSKTFLNSLAAATASIAVLQTTGGAANLSLLAAAGTGAFHQTDQACKLTITCGGDVSGVTFTVTGTDIAGNALEEAITGPDSTTVTGSKFFNTVTQIAASGAVGTNTSVGNAAGTTGGQAVVFAGRTRVRGMHITTGGTVGNISYFNSSPISGTSLFSFQVATTTKDYIDPYIPDDGVLFDSGAFLDLPAGTAVSVTTFFDG